MNATKLTRYAGVLALLLCGMGAAEARSLKDVAQLFTAGGSEPEAVDPEQAFGISVHGIGSDTVVARFDIADCCYLYRDKTRFEIAAGDIARVGRYTLPAGTAKTDEFFGTTEVYRGRVEVRLPLHGVTEADGVARLKVSFQGCSEKGVVICYPPTTRTFDIRPTNGALVAVRADGMQSAIAAGGPAPPGADPKARTFALSVLAAFGVGLLLTFTPCVLPMIPILSSVIVGSSDRRITKLEGGLLSLAYVFGTTVTYTAAGVVAGATGEQLQAYFQNAVALSLFAALFVGLALSMFGFYKLQIPSFIQSHLHRHSHRIHARARHVKGGAYAGVFIMGLMSALIVGACVSPLFISALGVAIANRDPVLGGAIMFSMALGMGVILIAIGVGAGVLLPKAGPWMETVKRVFGVMLVAVAIYLLGFIPQVPVLLLWSALLVVTAVYLGATQRVAPGAPGWNYLWKGIGTFLLIWGVLALIGGLAGNRDIVNPLPRTLFSETARPTGAERLFQPVTTLAELERQLAQARALGKPVMLDYYATWCTDCVRMEDTTFRDPRVRETVMTRFVALQADVTDPTHPQVKAIKQRFGVYGPPALLFFTAAGQERRDLRTYGYKSPEAFLALLAEL